MPDAQHPLREHQYPCGSAIFEEVIKSIIADIAAADVLLTLARIARATYARFEQTVRIIALALAKGQQIVKEQIVLTLRTRSAAFLVTIQQPMHHRKAMSNETLSSRRQRHSPTLHLASYLLTLLQRKHPRFTACEQLSQI